MRIYGVVFGSKEKDNLTFYTYNESPFEDWEKFGLESVVENFPFIFGGRDLAGWRPKKEDGGYMDVFYFPFLDINIDSMVYSPK